MPGFFMLNFRNTPERIRYYSFRKNQTKRTNIFFLLAEPCRGAGLLAFGLSGPGVRGFKKCVMV